MMEPSLASALANTLRALPDETLLSLLRAHLGDLPPACPAPAKLRAWREANGLTQREAAAEVGVSQPTWSEWEAGRSKPDIDSVARLTELGICDLTDWSSAGPP